MAEPHSRPPVRANAKRAWRLLAGGAAGGSVALTVAVVGFTIGGGAVAALSAAVAGGVTLAFFAFGQAAQAAVTDAEPALVLMVALTSYLTRVVGLGVLLWLALSDPVRLGLQPTPVVVTTIAVVVGWLGAELWVFSRLRIPVFDESEY